MQTQLDKFIKSRPIKNYGLELERWREKEGLNAQSYTKSLEQVFKDTNNINFYAEGVYHERNLELVKLVQEIYPRVIFEFASGWTDLAKNILEKFKTIESYFWTDFCQLCMEKSKSLLYPFKNSYWGLLDIDKDFRKINWDMFDTVICVSPEHLVNDIEILSMTREGTNIFLSCPNIDDKQHLRIYKLEEDIYERYKEIMDINKIIVFKNEKLYCQKFLVWGVRRRLYDFSGSCYRTLTIPNSTFEAYRQGWYKYLDSEEALILYQKIAETIKNFECKSVFDFGCGEAHLLKCLGNNISYCGFDSSSLAIQKAKERYGGRDNTIFMVGDWTLDFPGVFSDAIVLSGILAYIEDKENFIRSIIKKYKPRLLIISDIRSTDMRILDRILDLRLKEDIFLQLSDFKINDDRNNRFLRVYKTWLV